MKFVELVLSPSQRYAYKHSSDIEMNILGDFLASDVGYRSLPFKQWAYNSESQNISGTLTALKKDADSIMLTDIFTKNEPSATLQMTREQFIQMLDDWQEKVCNVQPKAMIIKQENNQFIIETITLIGDNSVTSRLALTPHTYPLWIKISFMLCCIILLVSLSGFPSYFVLNNKIKEARKAFNNKRYIEAASYYTELIKEMPNNKYIKLDLIQCLFHSQYIDDHMTAFDYLARIRDINKREWQKLLDCMPIQYAGYFQVQNFQNLHGVRS